jgi:hypothetical protein
LLSFVRPEFPKAEGAINESRDVLVTRRPGLSDEVAGERQEKRSRTTRTCTTDAENRAGIYI